MSNLSEARKLIEGELAKCRAYEKFIAENVPGYPAALRALLAVIQDIENCSYERDDDDHSGCPRCANLMAALAAFVGAMGVKL